MTEPPRDGPVRVLLVDDDPDDHLITRELFADLPAGRFKLDWVPTFDAGLAAVCAGNHDVYLIDYRLGPRTGLELLAEVRGRGCHGPMILLTGLGEYAIDQAAMAAGAADYLEKGRLDATLLERTIRYALRQHHAEAVLERAVKERTAELERINAALQQEVAERKRAEEALKQADRRKDEFLATLAHELRNPLAPIRNALEIMRLAGGKPAAVEQSRALMERQVGQMVRLIDDLLDVSRITRGKLRLKVERMFLAEALAAALEISRPVAEKAGVTLSVSLPDTPVPLDGDKVRLAQVFTNLLNNAAKFTEAGGRVSLIAELGLPIDDSDPSRKGTLPPGQSSIGNQQSAIVRVKDTGVGIPAEVLPRVFDMFAQADRTRERSQGGLGIGLALVKRLVEMHGGRVEAHSDGPGKGAEFVVRLPLAHGPPPVPEPH